MNEAWRCPMCKNDLADYLSVWVPPTALNTPDDPANAERIFDLAQAAVRLPQDTEFEDAAFAGRAAQYLSLEAVGIRRIHYNLCGEIVVAALVGMDMMPVLEKWLGYYGRARRILSANQVTGLGDLRNMLQMVGLDGEILRFDSKNRVTPKRLWGCTPAIVGVGIDRGGKVRRDGTIRHWVGLLDIAPVGLSGWARIYNPFHNREEAVAWRDLLDRWGRLTSVLKVVE